MISALLIIASAVFYVWLMRRVYLQAKQEERLNRLKGIQRHSNPWEW